MAAVEHRKHRELKINAEGPDDGTLPRTFRLESVTVTQRRDGRQKDWQDDGPRTRIVLAAEITRRELEALIADAASWLAWNGTDG